MPRPIWKGYITFGLVTIPVTLYSAENKSEIQFHLLDSRDKARIHYKRINSRTGKEVPWQSIAKGYEYDEDDYILLKEEDFKKITEENSKTINIETFVNQSSLDYMDFDKPYYLVPDKKCEKGYVILRETLKATKKVGIAKVIIHTRQYVAALMPAGDALILNLLRYHQEIRKPSEFDLPLENLKTYKITGKEMEVAEQLVASMTSKWNPDDYHDEYQATLQKWIKEKIHHEKPSKSKKKTTPTLAERSNVINFIDLLKKSIVEKKAANSKPHKRKKVTHK